MFQKILIANRGEIACRIIATAHRMGISTVAVYSQADAQARHVRLAGEAYEIGAPPARESYLRADAILQAATQSGAQAIHPGYGFLSENADFAEACLAAGIIFIGPKPASMRAMGSKSAAKSLMERSGVPLVPGYHGNDQSLDVLTVEAAKIGYPVLLKASAGGGGRGMRVVETPDVLEQNIDRARGEARTAFGNDHLLVEKYLTHPRHIEVQIFGDTHGNLISLFERDCSVQRRHQKVLEESPAPGITQQQRQALSGAAIAAARAVDYVGAGTVEFIYEDERFYFMEMNTRLQVEHPVTEFVTGLDLVEWQFRVAAGEKLPLAQNQIQMHGHAIEARICAEDPAHNFMPATGRVTHLRQPAETANVRVDTGIREGDTITPHYDSMIAKLIVWDTTRPAALRRLATALAAYEIVGPQTNLDLLRRIAVHPNFAEGSVDTGFIPHHPAIIGPETPPDPEPALWVAAALAALQTEPNQPPGDPNSPWGIPDGWRSLAPTTATINLRAGEGPTQTIIATRQTNAWHLNLPTGPVEATLDPAPDQEAILTLNGTTKKYRILKTAAHITIVHNGQNTRFTQIDPLSPPNSETTTDTNLTAPTPGRIIAVFVQPGATVAKGEKLLILEAMKVETTFTAPRDGIIDAVHVRAEEVVQEAAKLISFK